MKDETLHNLALSLAVELSTADFPNIWRVGTNSRDWWEQLSTTDAWIMMERDGKRLVFSTDHPRAMVRACYGEKITTAADRQPAAIARDLVNRLIPSARDYFQKCREASRKQKEAKERHAAMLHDLQHFTRRKSTDTSGHRTSLYTARTHADVYTDTIGELKINSPTIEETLKILAILEG